MSNTRHRPHSDVQIIVITNVINIRTPTKHKQVAICIHFSRPLGNLKKWIVYSLLYQCMHMFGSIIWGSWRSFYAFKLEVRFQHTLYTDLFLNFIFMLVTKPTDNRWYFYFCMGFILLVVYICAILLWFHCRSSLINNNDTLLIANKAGSVTLDLNKMARFVIIHDRHTLVDLIRRLRLRIFARFRRLWPSHAFVTKQNK